MMPFSGSSGAASATDAVSSRKVDAAAIAEARTSSSRLNGAAAAAAAAGTGAATLGSAAGRWALVRAMRLPMEDACEGRLVSGDIGAPIGLRPMLVALSVENVDPPPLSSPSAAAKLRGLANWERRVEKFAFGVYGAGSA